MQPLAIGSVDFQACACNHLLEKRISMGGLDRVFLFYMLSASFCKFEKISFFFLIQAIL